VTSAGVQQSCNRAATDLQQSWHRADISTCATALAVLFFFLVSFLLDFLTGFFFFVSASARESREKAFSGSSPPRTRARNGAISARTAVRPSSAISPRYDTLRNAKTVILFLFLFFQLFFIFSKKKDCKKAEPRLEV
jgi:hypothetical protein